MVLNLNLGKNASLRDIRRRCKPFCQFHLDIPHLFPVHTIPPSVPYRISTDGRSAATDPARLPCRKHTQRVQYPETYPARSHPRFRCRSKGGKTVYHNSGCLFDSVPSKLSPPFRCSPVSTICPPCPKYEINIFPA